MYRIVDPATLQSGDEFVVLSMGNSGARSVTYKIDGANVLRWQDDQGLFLPFPVSPAPERMKEILSEARFTVLMMGGG